MTEIAPLPEGYSEVTPLPEGYTEIPLSRKAGARAMTGAQSPAGTWSETYDQLNSREPGVDYQTGVQDTSFRAGFSRMDTEEERDNWLDTNVGEGAWRKDKYGAYLLSPGGMAKIGQPSEQETAIDEQSVTGYDVADWAGGAPAALAGFGAGMASTGYGFIPGVLMMALGGASGKALDELIETFQGYQRQKTVEIAEDVAIAGLEEGVAEMGVRGLRPLGRKLLGPKTTRPKAPGFFKKQPDVESVINPERLSLVKQAQDIGAQPKISQATGKQAPLTGRLETMVHTIFSDPTLAANRDALIQKMGELTQKAGKGVSASSKTAGDAVRKTILAMRDKLEKNISGSQATARTLLDKAQKELKVSLGPIKEDAGEKIIGLIRQGRESLSTAANGRYTQFDAMMGFDPVVPTQLFKDVVTDSMKRMPKTDTGEPAVFMNAEVKTFFQGITKLGDFTTAQEMQTIRTTLREAAYSPDILPGVAKHYLAKLHKAADKSFDMVGDVQPYRKVPVSVYDLDYEDLLNAPIFIKKPIKIDPEQLKAGIDHFRETNKWYRTEISKFDDAFVLKLARDAHKPGAVDPEQVVDYIVKGGMASRVHRLRKILPTKEWKMVQATHFDSMLRNSEDLTGEINGSLLLRKVNNLGKTLDATYGGEAGKIRKYAAELAASNGKISPDELKKLVSGNSSVADVLKKSVKDQVRLDSLKKQSFFKKWSSETFDPEEAADYLLRPKNSREINWAKEFLGENSKEWLMLRESSMGRILKNIIDDVSDPVDTILNGKALKAAIKNIGNETLKGMFGDGLAKELNQFVKVAHFLTTRPDASGGIVAASIALHPLKNITRLAKFFVIRKMFSTGAGVRYFTEGFKPNATKKTMDALTRYVASSVAQYQSESTSGGLDFGKGATDPQVEPQGEPFVFPIPINETRRP